MSYTRWYDKDQNLKLIMDTLENVEDETKLSIAVDLVQMIAKEKVPYTDDMIDELNSFYIKNRRRWYDYPETLHSAIELLKQVDDEIKDEIFKEILYSIFHFITHNNSVKE